MKKADQVVGKCDICGKDVTFGNDAETLMRASHRLSGDIAALMYKHRHLLPVPGCPGSPSRAQYLEDQPRDTRPGTSYDPSQEEPLRLAYQRMNSE